MLAGVYIMGPCLIMLSVSTQNAGFATIHDWGGWRDLAGMTIIPLYTLVLATYNLSLLGVLAVTGIGVYLHMSFDRQSRRGR